MRMLEIYRDFIENDLAIPVIPGRKSESEKFAGAQETYTLESLMPDGQALQSCTSHFFGDNFAKAFGITFQDQDGVRKHVHTTSWGLSWRTVGALIMVHGDDSGLIMPPRVAPTQVVIVPIRGDDPAVREAGERLARELGSRFRVEADWSDKSPGWKFNEWEMRGVPIRVEIGPRDVKAGQAVVVGRDSREKSIVPLEELGDAIAAQLDALHGALYERALADRESRTSEASSLDELAGLLKERPGFIRAHWCGSPECEARVKAETGATIRCIPLDEPEQDGACVVDGRPSRQRVLFARAY
jgi:prolyl-tRNA synthetase